jgi:FkbM family methyltransferase
MIRAILQHLPVRVQQSIYYRLLNPPPKFIKPYFSGAQLKYAPNISMDLVFGDVLHGSIATLGFYEPNLSQRIVEVGRQCGGLMVDVGANAGYFSLLWLSQRPENRCVLFEPVARNVELIKANLRKNQLEKRADVRPIALGREDGELCFDLGPEGQTGWGGFKMTEDDRTIRVPVKRLDQEVHKNITLLKIDTEGADAWVLQGAHDLLLQRLVDEVHFEDNTFRAQKIGIEDDEASSFLESVGYTVEQSEEDAFIARAL